MGKIVSQYYFATRSLAIFTALHSLWYVLDPTSGKYVKIVPMYLADVFTPAFVAYWLMDDGYWENDGKTIYFCTECFTKLECLFLIELLAQLGIVATLKLRNKSKDTYRIRISRLSLPLFRKLVMPYMHPVYLYKLGPV